MDSLIEKVDFIIFQLGEIKRKCYRMDKQIDVVERFIGANLRTHMNEFPLDSVV